MKKPLIILSLFIYLISYSQHIYATVNFIDKKNENTEMVKDILYTVLSTHISQAIDQYYEGETRRNFGLYDIEILDIKRPHEGGFEFIVTLQVPTYVGAHNPPYGLEIITFNIKPGRVELINYQHIDTN